MTLELEISWMTLARLAFNALRSPILDRPPFGLGGSGGITTFTRCQTSLSSRVDFCENGHFLNV